MTTPTLTATAPTPTRPVVSPAVVAAALGIAGLAYRVVLVASGTPPANSDEGTAGLAALHIAAGREFPIFFYGQQYLGTLQSYLAAPLVTLFGPSWWALRIPPLLCYVAFLVLSFKLTVRLYTPWFAVFIVGVLAFGSDRVIKNQLIGAGGYAEMLPAVTALALVAVLLVQRRVGHRLAGFAVWGGLAGLTVWTHWLALPYVAATGALLVGLCWRELRGRAGLVVIAATVVGAAPLLVHNLTATQNSFSVFRSISGAEAAAPLVERLHGAVMVGLPLSHGLCAPSACSPAHMWWGPAYVLLLISAGVLAGRAWRHAARSREASTDETVICAGRLVLLAAAALTVAAYIASASAAKTPIESARYLHYSLASLPAVLWPLWSAVSRRRSLAATAVAGVVLTLFAAQLAVATGTLVRHAPALVAGARDERVLIAELDRIGAHRIYSEYWTCNRLAYLTGERVVCAVLGDDLRPGLDRYRPYRPMVESARSVYYLFPAGSAVDREFARRAARRGGDLLLRRIAGYHIYGPTDHHLNPRVGKNGT